MRKLFFPLIICATALGLAAIAAFFSITGMSSIFPGWSIIVMTAAIEIGKLVSVSVLYRMWKQLSWLKWLLMPMTIVIMLITSIGIYGHLSSKYEGTASGMRTHESRLRLEAQKKEGIQDKIASYESAMKRKQDRAGSLITLRSNQETRLDSLYARNQLRSARDVQASIAQADREISLLNSESDSLNALIDASMVEISSLDSVVIKMESDVSGGEAATIKFIAKAVGTTTDSAANIFMLLIIFVFDPLAILLLVVFNIAVDGSKNDPKPDDPKLDDTDGVLDAQEEQQEQQEERKEGQEEEEQPKEADEASITESTVDQHGKVSNEERKLDEDELYSLLLYVLYNNGTLTENDHLDLYDEFMRKVKSSNINCTEAQVDAFLQMCVDMKIIRIGKEQRVALKSYTDALEKVRNRTSK